MSIGEIVSITKDIVLALCGVGTFSLAVYGVKNWARELKGKTEFEVSRQFIRAVYKFRDEIEYSRSPMTLANEYPLEYDPMNKNEKYQAEAWAHVFSNRWKPVVNAVLELDAQALEAEALWGTEVKQLVNDLRRNAQLLRVGMQAIIDNEMNGNQTFQSNPNLAMQMRGRVWKQSHDHGDEITESMISIVGKLENFLRPYLKRN
ncbi:hypothetical protein [Aeromonas enteropelogenes]|uniref:hypothetical protein n=1 Tax=Aeromonas enteropelogenes TaxID=29489 RepID=UPI003BA09C34